MKVWSNESCKQIVCLLHTSKRPKNRSQVSLLSPLSRLPACLPACVDARLRGYLPGCLAARLRGCVAACLRVAACAAACLPGSLRVAACLRGLAACLPGCLPAWLRGRLPCVAAKQFFKIEIFSEAFMGSHFHGARKHHRILLPNRGSEFLNTKQERQRKREAQHTHDRVLFVTSCVLRHD